MFLLEFKTHSCLALPPNVPSHPFVLSVQPCLQHMPSEPHQAQGPCLELQLFQQSFPELSSAIAKIERVDVSFLDRAPD